MPEIKFDMEDYYDDETIRDMIEDETRRYIRGRVSDMMLNHDYWVPNFITLTAESIVKDVLDGEIPKWKQQTTDKVQDLIDGMETFDIKYSDVFKRVMSECIEEYRPLIRSKVNEVCAENIDANYLVDCVSDEFYNMLHKMLADD